MRPGSLINGETHARTKMRVVSARRISGSDSGGRARTKRCGWMDGWEPRGSRTKEERAGLTDPAKDAVPVSAIEPLLLRTRCQPSR